MSAEANRDLLTRHNRDLLFIDEAAVETRKSVATLRWLRATGQGPRSGKLGRRVVYRREDLEAWLNSAFDEGGAA